MPKQNKRSRWWVLVLLLAAISTTSMTGCIFVDRDHPHHEDHHDWR